MIDKMSDQATVWIDGCTRWIEEHCFDGWWQPYYVNFMFDPLPGSSRAVVFQMHKAIQKFYGQFCTRFVRNPRAEVNQRLLPLFWLFPDKPTWKRGRTIRAAEMKFNDGGLHFNGPMLIPVASRFTGCPILYFQENQHRYARRGISRIHVSKLYDGSGLADYAAKTLKWNRCDEADILILPRSPKEIAKV